MIVVLLLLASAGVSPHVDAHGKELAITVDSLVPDPAQPLRVLYRVTVAYAGDQVPRGGRGRGLGLSTPRR